MSECPLVSIVICTCNRQNLLKNAIEVAFNQTYPNTEVICILGMNSGDMSEEMLTELRAKNLIKFVKNYGTRIDARNMAFKIASGKYICFLDDDDTMLATRVEKQVAFLEEHSDIDICSCATMLSQTAGLMHTFKDLTDTDIKGLVAGDNNDIDEIVSFQSCMFRRDKINSIFGDEKIFDNLFIAGGEGQMMLYECMFKHNIKFANISGTIYIYQAGLAENSITRVCEPVFYNEHLFRKPFNDKFEFVINFRKDFPLTNTEAPTEKPKRGRKKKTENKEISTEKPKRGRKKKEVTEETVTEKPKRGRKKKEA